MVCLLFWGAKGRFDCERMPMMLAELAHKNHQNYTWVPAMEILSEVGVDAYFYDDTLDASKCASHGTVDSINDLNRRRCSSPLI